MWHVIKKNAANLFPKAASEGRLDICKWLVAEVGCDASVKDRVSCVFWLLYVMHEDDCSTCRL